MKRDLVIEEEGREHDWLIHAGVLAFQGAVWLLIGLGFGWVFWS